jgi:dihydrofolate reductase
VTISVIAAVARGGVIGRDGGIPWRLPEDLARFREVTMGHPVVMGRRTWESLPERFRPLPGRRNVVVTRNPRWSAAGAERASSVEDALLLLEPEAKVFVIGGGEVYSAALHRADEVLLTEIDATVDGDTRFPAWGRDEFEEVARERHVAGDGTPFAFVTYRRRADAARQLGALASIDESFRRAGIDYWLFGGWAVDFYAGRITRPHFDVDVAIRLDEVPRIRALLEDAGWRHAPDPDEDGGTGYERSGVRLELTYLVRKPDGAVVIPLRASEAMWPDGAFGQDTRELRGVRARLVGLSALARGKASPRDDPADAAKDRADSVILAGL